jgi:hypothetical protein
MLGCIFTFSSFCTVIGDDFVQEYILDVSDGEVDVDEIKNILEDFVKEIYNVLTYLYEVKEVMKRKTNITETTSNDLRLMRIKALR